MPKQELFFEQENEGRRVEVLKSYDQAYAREAFGNMNEDGQKRLWSLLKPEDIYEAEELPKLGDAEGEAEAFLWDELVEQAREEGAMVSFFIVNETVNRRTSSLYVSPEWPSAEAFAKERLKAALQ